MTTLFLDLETWCETPIRDGTHAYAEGAEIIVWAWAIDDGPVEVCEEWTRALREVLFDRNVTIVFHNSGFDRTVLRHNGVTISPERIHDTMVQALSHGLPGGLDKLCEIFKIPVDQAKDKAGRALIQLFCKPSSTRKVRRATRDTHPVEWARFLDYARLDITSMRALYKTMPRWNYPDREHALWCLDQRMNDRGFAVDLDLARAAIDTVNLAKKTMDAATGDLTHGDVHSTTQRDQLLKHLVESWGVDLPDMQKSTLERRLGDESLPWPVRELIAIRLQVSTTSNAKYNSLLKAVSSDGRLRGSMQFSGAARTKRWCLAEGSLVLTKSDVGRVEEIPIQDVTLDHRVWDGEEWVTHEGVVFSGDKEVIEHDNVVATAEHIVYLSTTEHITLGEAKNRGVALWRGNDIQCTG